jgi:hypothetical protein
MSRNWSIISVKRNIVRTYKFQTHPLIAKLIPTVSHIIPAYEPGAEMIKGPVHIHPTTAFHLKAKAQKYPKSKLAKRMLAKAEAAESHYHKQQHHPTVTHQVALHKHTVQDMLDEARSKRVQAEAARKAREEAAMDFRSKVYAQHKQQLEAGLTTAEKEEREKLTGELMRKQIRSQAQLTHIREHDIPLSKVKGYTPPKTHSELAQAREEAGSWQHPIRRHGAPREEAVIGSRLVPGEVPGGYAAHKARQEAVMRHSAAHQELMKKNMRNAPTNVAPPLSPASPSTPHHIIPPKSATRPLPALGGPPLKIAPPTHTPPPQHITPTTSVATHSAPVQEAVATERVATKTPWYHDIMSSKYGKYAIPVGVSAGLAIGGTALYRHLKKKQHTHHQLHEQLNYLIGLAEMR